MPLSAKFWFALVCLLGVLVILARCWGDDLLAYLLMAAEGSAVVKTIISVDP